MFTVQIKDPVSCVHWTVWLRSGWNEDLSSWR